VRKEKRRISVTTLPHNFKRIRLNLARSKEFPLGSSRHGYEFVAPLDAEGHIDLAQWKKEHKHCRVRRFWEGEEDQTGQVMFNERAPEGSRWFFDYDQEESEDDERGYRFGTHVFRPGEYVSIRDEDGEMHTFQVVSVEAAT
jgi:hypothetical protein